MRQVAGGRRREGAVRRRTRLAAALSLVAWAASAPAAMAAPSASIVPTPNPGKTNLIGGLVTFGSDVWAVGSTGSPTYTA